MESVRVVVKNLSLFIVLCKKKVIFTQKVDSQIFFNYISMLIDPNSLCVAPLIFDRPVPVPVPVPVCKRIGYYGSNFMMNPCINRCGWNGWTSYF